NAPFGLPPLKIVYTRTRSFGQHTVPIITIDGRISSMGTKGDRRFFSPGKCVCPLFAPFCRRGCARLWHGVTRRPPLSPAPDHWRGRAHFEARPHPHGAARQAAADWLVVAARRRARNRPGS